jgi:hypothetical protein
LSDSAGRISRAAESISQTVAQLPDRLSTERKEILATLESQEGKWRELVAGLDQALASGQKMSDSVTITVTNVDALLKRLGMEETATNAVVNTNSTPFNILDYSRTATEADNLAKDLNILVNSLNRSETEIQRLSQQAGADVQKAVDHGFRLGLVLVVVLLAGSVLAALLYNFLARKTKPTASAGPKP